MAGPVREVERPKYTATDIVRMMKNEGYQKFGIHGKRGFVDFWKSVDGKNPGKGFGTEVVGNWVWYEKMVDSVRTELESRNKIEN